MAYYRTPSRFPAEAFSPLTALHAAHALLDESGDLPPSAKAVLDMDYLARMGCAEKVDDWRAICRSGRLEGVRS